jgi:hypothetical protein
MQIDSQKIGDCDVYTEHAQPTQVAKYSPSGFYIASGDQSGKIRIWDTTQSVIVLHSELPKVPRSILLVVVPIPDSHFESRISNNQWTNSRHCLVWRQQADGCCWRGQGKVGEEQFLLTKNNIFIFQIWACVPLWHGHKQRKLVRPEQDHDCKFTRFTIFFHFSFIRALTSVGRVPTGLSAALRTILLPFLKDHPSSSKRLVQY